VAGGLHGLCERHERVKMTDAACAGEEDAHSLASNRLDRPAGQPRERIEYRP